MPIIINDERLPVIVPSLRSVTGTRDRNGPGQPRYTVNLSRLRPSVKQQTGGFPQERWCAEHTTASTGLLFFAPLAAPLSQRAYCTTRLTGRLAPLRRRAAVRVAATRTARGWPSTARVHPAQVLFSEIPLRRGPVVPLIYLTHQRSEMVCQRVGRSRVTGSEADGEMGFTSYNFLLICFSMGVKLGKQFE